MLLVGIFVYAFFKFTWSLRQHTMSSVLVGAAPKVPRRCAGRGRLYRPRLSLEPFGSGAFQQRVAGLLLRNGRARMDDQWLDVHGHYRVGRLDPVLARVPLGNLAGAQNGRCEQPQIKINASY